VAASAATVLTLAMGWAFLELPLRPEAVNLPLLVPAMALGLTSAVALGLLLVTLAMSISGDAWRMPEGVGAALYLICGVIFPIQVLPGPLATFARFSPLTWWLEAVRRGLLGPNAMAQFPELSNAAVLARLTGLTVVFTLIAGGCFQAGLRRARALGILDRESAH
jgi:ABC-type polysaccharide/polyol phosphate export permease